MKRNETKRRRRRRRRIYGNPVDAFLSTIEETIPQVLKASSLSTLSSSPCSPGGCTLSSVQLSFLPRGENDPSSPYSLSLSTTSRGRISIGRKKSHLTIVGGAPLAVRERKVEKRRERETRILPVLYLLLCVLVSCFRASTPPRAPGSCAFPTCSFPTCRETCLLTVSAFAWFPLHSFFYLISSILG